MSSHPMVSTWKQSIEDGTFLTSKHAPDSTGVPHNKYRSITTTDASGLYDFFSGGDYSITRYKNNHYPKTPEYFVIKPNDPSFIPGSGVPSGSMNPSQSLDCFVVVSGTKQGWHIHAEDSVAISTSINTGKLSLWT